MKRLTYLTNLIKYIIISIGHPLIFLFYSQFLFLLFYAPPVYDPTAQFFVYGTSKIVQYLIFSILIYTPFLAIQAFMLKSYSKIDIIEFVNLKLRWKNVLVSLLHFPVFIEYVSGPSEVMHHFIVFITFPLLLVSFIMFLFELKRLLTK